jgi:ribosome assembly protein RRB1
MTFDVLPDNLGDKREDFPMTCYMVAGTLAERSHTNKLIVLKMSNLNKTTPEEKDDEDSESDESDMEDDQPELETAMLNHNGGVNRIRVINLVNHKCCDTGIAMCCLSQSMFKPESK